MHIFKRTKNKNRAVPASELVKSIGGMFVEGEAGGAKPIQKQEQKQKQQQQITMKIFDESQII